MKGFVRIFGVVFVFVDVGAVGVIVCGIVRRGCVQLGKFTLYPASGKRHSGGVSGQGSCQPHGDRFGMSEHSLSMSQH